MDKRNSIRILNFVEDFKMDDLKKRGEKLSKPDSEIIIENIKGDYDKSLNNLILFVVVPKGIKIPINILEKNSSYFSVLISLDPETTNNYSKYFNNFVELSSEEEVQKFILGLSLQVIGTYFVGLDVTDLRELFLKKGRIYLNEFDIDNLEKIKNISKVNSAFTSIIYKKHTSLEKSFKLAYVINDLLKLDDFDSIIGIYEDKFQNEEKRILIYTTKF